MASIKKGFSGAYFKVSFKGFFEKEKFDEILRTEMRAVHAAWGDRMAAGYNKIVADWSPETRPHFQSITRYFKSTKSVFVYVYIRGTQQQKLIFNMIDHGARRGQTVSAGPGVPRTDEEEATLKNYRKPLSPLIAPSPPRGYRPDPLSRAAGRPSAMRPWLKHDKEMARFQKRVSKGKATKAKREAGPGRTRKGSRLGVSGYTTRTNVSGAYKGAGYSASANPAKSRNRGATADSNWRNYPQPKSIKLKPIKARKYSLRLRWLIRGRSWPWAEEIWGPKNKMLHENIIRIGYRNVARAIKASK